MAVQAQYYLTCSECGKEFADTDGQDRAEEPQELRDLAIENGWICNRGILEENDYCPKHISQ